ncbi:hypothetical protein O1D97_09915 [Marinomonas sp. 15G1-11]|uniref:Uncharacterized protein n=1 Tax=Marinomonas phaeophyticola TaxID=3004091 RepID=A0ABT4JUB1_9GAMM|nr:hypothetical protein [Marinomonas sp. 15G1-11]MCZ2721957.1 hypothetical protein [Marinomonas sp. 15G1-11]
MIEAVIFYMDEILSGSELMWKAVLSSLGADVTQAFMDNKFDIVHMTIGSL